MWRMRSARKNTAPLSTPTSSRSRALVVARRSARPSSRTRVAQVVGLDEDLADRAGRAWPRVYGSSRARGERRASRSKRRTPPRRPRARRRRRRARPSPSASTSSRRGRRARAQARRSASSARRRTTSRASARRQRGAGASTRDPVAAGERRRRRRSSSTSASSRSSSAVRSDVGLGRADGPPRSAGTSAVAHAPARVDVGRRCVASSRQARPRAAAPGARSPRA